jgi:methylthioribose-1-phosphate isomerase
MIYKAFDAGKIRKVFALETRPLLQGARLTAWELTNSGVPITLLPDGAAASLLKQEGIDLAIIGADRIAANGDTANKIGSLALAICCKRFNVPLYIAAPTATIDPTLTGGSGIPIEIRSGEEVTHFGTYRSAPVEIEAYNPAFDVVDAELISGFVTESGIIKPPYRFA